MSALTSINTPALHGRRSAAKPARSAQAQSAKQTRASEPGSLQATAVKQPAAVLKPAAATPPAAVVVSTDAAAAPGAFRRIAGRTFKIIGAGMLVLAALAFVFLAIGPRLLGYQTSTMLTGSMAPLINPGDVVVT
ncbi:MAG TPA: S26 family signal peptidase, partial [Paenarthrobacter sp.]|nr:S26 family signal peptidase [Paenarthrobacter sp.]